MPNQYKKIIPVKYTARDFSSIREELVEYARRYYPSTFRDFNEASFGALMVDTVSYVGDMLSFYMDYQANESFIDTSIEYGNVINHSRRLGYQFRSNPTAFGMGTFFVLVPATVTGTPDADYMPILRRGSIFSSINGNQYILNEDVDTSHQNNEIVVARADEETGLPTWFAVKTSGQLISGVLALATVEIGEFKKFRRISINVPDVAEIISVVDSEGHTYHEVDFLSQNVIYKQVKNTKYSGGDGEVQHLLKPFIVPRRFVVEQEENSTILQFGYGSDSESTTASVADPTSLVLEKWGKEHVSDETFDPSKLLKTDKFGIAPANTILTIVYRANSSSDVNAATDSITEVINADLQFKNLSSLNANTVSYIQQNVECTNEEPIIGDINTETVSEIKRRAKDAYATQSRAVTKQDYISTVYSMPSKFGAIKRCNILRDHNALKRNMNLHVVSEASDGTLVRTNDSIKSNLKVWLGKNKMVNDTIDILDARVLNLQIEFSILGDVQQNRFEILNKAKSALASFYTNIPDVSEPFYLSDTISVLKDVEGVADVLDVHITQLSGGDYSDLFFDVDAARSADGRMIRIPEDVIWEVKYPDADIKGVVK